MFSVVGAALGCLAGGFQLSALVLIPAALGAFIAARGSRLAACVACPDRFYLLWSNMFWLR